MFALDIFGPNFASFPLEREREREKERSLVSFANIIFLSLSKSLEFNLSFSDVMVGTADDVG